MAKDVRVKRAEANERNDYRKGLSNANQIKRLDKRLGTGIGAGVERARLSKHIARNVVQL